MVALHRLASTLNSLSVNVNEELETKLIMDPEYIMLSGVFNSIFLCPMIVYSCQYTKLLINDPIEHDDEEESDGVPVIIDVMNENS
jgi:hypothetical protein